MMLMLRYPKKCKQKTIIIKTLKIKIKQNKLTTFTLALALGVTHDK
jgi:hypothetical protein